MRRASYMRVLLMGETYRRNAPGSDEPPINRLRQRPTAIRIAHGGFTMRFASLEAATVAVATTNILDPKIAIAARKKIRGRP